MRPTRFDARLLVVVFALIISFRTSGAGQGAASTRTIVVLSDMHMGVGRDAAGSWLPLEDFRWTAEFTEFIKALDAAGHGATDLILNGDTFELLQSTRKDCVSADPGLGCTEGEALGRLERVLSAHTAEINALGQFARSGSNHLVFVPGDHDAGLLFPSLARRVVTALGAPEGRAEVATSGYWLSADGRIYAEHGHQVGFSAHRFDNWPSPFLRRSSGLHLARPWGEQTIQDFYNRYEERYPILDNVAEAGLGAKYALAAEEAPGTNAAASRLLHYFLLKMSYQQFRLTDYTGGEPPVWDLAKVRAEGPAFLVGSLPDDDPFKPLATKALNDGGLAKEMGTLTDDEIVGICDYRGAVRRSRRRMEPLNQFPPAGPAVDECPRTSDTRGPAFEYFWRTRDVMMTHHLEAVAKRIPRADNPIVVFVVGHTHLPDRSQALYNKVVPEGFSPVRNAATPIVINDGAWQRTITPLQLDRIKTERGLPLRQVLGSMLPEQLAPCYSFVQIGPYNGTPAPAVRYWRQAKQGDWQVAPGCGR